MANLNCDRRCFCTVIAVVSSAFVGIIAAILRLTAVITLGPAFLWVVLGVAVGSLALTLVTTAFGGRDVRSCVRSIFSALITGIIGAIVTSLILLAIEFVATSIIGAIITGALVGFFALIITVTACLVRCIARSAQ